MYTDDKNAQIILALLKKYNIKKIVISPGTTNVPIARCAQTDSFFEAYSVVDERSAAYFATGLAHESGEPVVISCTGATASRNYLPALTEAYYRNLPIMAITSYNQVNDYANFKPQSINRTVSQMDVKRMSVNLPLIKDKIDEEAWILSVNKALTLATKKGGGPVHINLPVDLSKALSFTTENLPDIPKIDYYHTEDVLDNECLSLLKNGLQSKKIALLIGCHRKFSCKEIEAIERFIDTYDTTVFYDHTSNYHGKNRILSSVASGLRMVKIKPEIVIDIGSVTPIYSAQNLFKGIEFWRISEDGEFHQRYFGNLCKQFDCSEYIFFNSLADIQTKSENAYYNAIIGKMGKVEIPDLPLSNTLISSQMASKLPEGCAFHIGVSESFSCMNFFELKESIDSSCNAGAMGIDGAVSTLMGQSMVNKNKLYFGQFGDLTFFYDMNILGNRHVGNNVRILIVNNGGGARFRLSPPALKNLGTDVDEFIGAFGHNGSAEGWVKSMGFEYLTANTKEEFLFQIEDFCSPDINKFDKPVIFEVFTTVENEQEGLHLIREANKPPSSKAKEIVRQILPSKAVNMLKKLKN